MIVTYRLFGLANVLPAFACFYDLFVSAVHLRRSNSEVSDAYISDFAMDHLRLVLRQVLLRL